MPKLRVDHVSIAVPAIEPALDFFLELFPAAPGRAPAAGYDGQFRWTDFTIGNFKIELIDSLGPGSFVERFIAKRGPGFHHLSLGVDELAPVLERLERDGARIVDRHDEGNGHETAFIHPRSAFGALIQFWQEREIREGVAPGWGGVVRKDGVRWQVDHLSLALESLPPAVDFFRRHFGARVEIEPHLGYDRTFRLTTLRIGDYRLELMEPVRPESFLTRFLARRGSGMHHLSIDVENLDDALAPFEARGLRIVDRFEVAPGRKTAFLHPHSAYGALIQFWEMPVAEWSAGTLT